MMKRAIIPFLLIAAAGLHTCGRHAAAETPEPTPTPTTATGDVPATEALAAYIRNEDNSFEWELVGQTTTDTGTIYELRVTSQTWQGIVWKHAVEIYEPKQMQFPEHAILFVTGGSNPSPPGVGDMLLGMRLASTSGTRVVMLHQTPNQPLLGGRKEDDLISETWLRYLQTGDATWPLLFPMVKSAVRTMDAVDSFSQQQWDRPIKRFVITGASKRGWTSWLTPVADDRIIATAPIVIDVLNFRSQMNHQLNTWGAFSPQIIDYTRKGLVERPGETESPREAALRTMMDPYTYRKKLTLPKLLIVGTNDPYWVVDAMNLYWDDLQGPKVIRQVPNAGHGLDGGREGALDSLAAFFRHIAADHPLPEICWDFVPGSEKATLTMHATPKPAVVRFWSARSEDKDFRDARWTNEVVKENDSTWIGTVSRQPEGHVAVFGELEFETEGQRWSLTTLVYRQ